METMDIMNSIDSGSIARKRLAGLGRRMQRDSNLKEKKDEETGEKDVEGKGKDWKSALGLGDEETKEKEAETRVTKENSPS